MHFRWHPPLPGYARHHYSSPPRHPDPMKKLSRIRTEQRTPLWLWPMTPAVHSAPQRRVCPLWQGSRSRVRHFRVSRKSFFRLEELNCTGEGFLRLLFRGHHPDTVGAMGSSVTSHCDKHHPSGACLDPQGGSFLTIY